MAMRRTDAGEDADGGRARRVRRTEEQLIRDLEAKLASLRERAEAREVKSSPAIQATLAALRAIDKAVEAATQEEDTALRHVLADARAPLEGHLDQHGIRIPKTRRPKGPRPRGGA
jgi:hypothetical protein